jgi:hypothetical protein
MRIENALCRASLLPAIQVVLRAESIAAAEIAVAETMLVYVKNQGGTETRQVRTSNRVTFTV